jgi:hypothetical protein
VAASFVEGLVRQQGSFQTIFFADERVHPYQRGRALLTGLRL